MGAVCVTSANGVTQSVRPFRIEKSLIGKV